ncbi:MFS transporter [Actinomadura sp. NAK00032]|uniref:MFS transporter n=1 Tax=Actinomadura sp. NAK00032 TaxID=2742128 RepID=UPI001591000A|nr:MFS transporter [Actinomadura sp. NAK00032]QKW39683.1 MFS transporter [Actinomadura sp. NAK00032]
MARESAAPAAAEPDPGAEGPPRPDARRWLVLAVICVAQLMVVLDVTVMNLALPPAQDDLGFTDADRQWILTAYLLSFGSLLLFCGRLADLIGNKPTFLAGVTGFAAASAVGGAANGLEMLVASRAGQGIFAALLAPAALSLLATTFTDPKERGRAYGAFGAVAASGAGLGLIIGGGLTSALSWRWCMYINVVFAAIVLLGAALPMGGKPRPSGVRLDVPGVVTVSGGMFCLVYGFSNAADESWGTPSTWGFLAAGAVLLTVFGWWQTRAAQPLLPPRVVLDRNRAGAYLTMLVVGGGMFGIFLFLIYYMQTILGYSAIRSGMALLPMVVLTGAAANVGNIKLMPRFGPRPLVFAGLTLSAGGTAWLTMIDADSGYASVLLGPTLVAGAGMGLLFASGLQTGTSGIAAQDAGVASASLQIGQQLGGAIGTALLNTIAASATTGYLDDHARGRPSPELIELAAVDGYITVFWWSAGIFAVGAVLCALLLRGGPLSEPEDPPIGADAAAAGKPIEEAGAPRP